MTPHDRLPRLTPRERVVVGLPVALLVGLGLLHLVWLRPVVGMSTWKGGGLGVYCTVLDRRVATWVDLGDGPRLAHTTPTAGARLFGGWFPYVPLAGPGWLEAHAARTGATPFVPAGSLGAQERARPSAEGRLPGSTTTQEWHYDYAADGPRWRLDAVRTHP